MSADQKPLRRRWFQFSLRTLFVVVTAVSCWMAWNVHVVNERKAEIHWIQDHGGSVFLALNGGHLFASPFREPVPVCVSWHRRLFGDSAIDTIFLPSGTSTETVKKVQTIFPEADVIPPIRSRFSSKLHNPGMFPDSAIHRSETD